MTHVQNPLLRELVTSTRQSQRWEYRPVFWTSTYKADLTYLHRIMPWKLRELESYCPSKYNSISGTETQ